MLFCCSCSTQMLWLSELGLCPRGVRSRRKASSKNENFVVVCVPRRPYGYVAELMIQLAMTAVSLQEEHLSSSHVHLAVGTPQCHDLH